jgi:hypothetical protein
MIWWAVCIEFYDSASRIHWPLNQFLLCILLFLYLLNPLSPMSLLSPLPKARPNRPALSDVTFYDRAA